MSYEHYTSKTNDELVKENIELKLRLDEAEDTLNAIRNGEIDAIVVDNDDGSKVYTLESADYFYRVLVQEMNEGLATLTYDGTIFYGNAQLASTLKVPLKEMIGHRLIEFIHPGDLSLYQSIFDEGIQNGSIGEVRLKSINGLAIPVQISINTSKSVKGIYAVITDLSEQKHHEELKKLHEQLKIAAEDNKLLLRDMEEYNLDLEFANEKLQDTTKKLQTAYEELQQQRNELLSVNHNLQESEERYRILFDTMSEGFSYNEIILDDNGKPSDLLYLAVNPAFEDQTGLKAENIIGKTAHEIFPNISEILWLDRYYKVVQTGEPVHFEERFGPLKQWFEVKAYKIGDNRFAAVFNDITDRKNNDMMLKESEERFRSVLDNSHDVIYRFNEQTGIYDYISPSAKNIVGYSPDELMALDLDASLKMVHPDDRSIMNDSLAHLKDTDEVELEYRQRTKNGDYRWISNHMTITKDVDGKPLYRNGNIRDITKRKNAEDELKITLNELKRSNQELEQFAYVASHDLQEPLRMISSFTQLLERKYKDKLDTEALEYINFTVDGAKRMQLLINDLLAFSRVNTKGEEFKELDLEKVLDEVLFNLEIVIEENQAIITNDHLPRICADHGQMIQLFQNLLGNALKYRSQNIPQIHISARKIDKEWMFSVKDNGIGIDPQYNEQIFQIFRRLHTHDEYEGTGIGLAITKKIIQRHKGRIWVESELGKGSNFYFTIPHILN